MTQFSSAGSVIHIIGVFIPGLANTLILSHNKEKAELPTISRNQHWNQPQELMCKEICKNLDLVSGRVNGCTVVKPTFHGKKWNERY